MTKIKKSSSSATLSEKALGGPFFRMNSLPMWIFDRESYRFMEVNNAAIRKYGFSRTEFLKMKVSEIRPAEDAARFIKTVSGVRGAVFQSKGEWQHKLKDGNVIFVEIHASMVRFRGMKAVLSIIYDLTDRKRAEEELKLHGLLFKNISEIVLYVRLKDLRVIEANEAARTAFGYTHEEFLSMTVYDIRPEETRSSIQDQYTSKYTDDLTYETINRRKDGTTFHTQYRQKRLTFGGEEIALVLGRDLTERMQTETALRKSEENFRTTFEQAAVGMAQVGTDGKWLRVNDRLCNIVGYSREELLARKFQDITHPDDILGDMEGLGELLQNRKHTVSREKRSLRKDGSMVWLAITASVHESAARIIDYIIVVVEDISARKETEEALRQSERKFRKLFYNAEVGMFRTKLDGSAILDFNQKYLDIFGRTRGEMLATRTIDHWADPHEREEMVRRLQKDGYVEDYECKLLTKNGEARDCLTSVRLYPEQGVLEGSIEDVTERRQARERLTDALKYVQTIFDNSPIGIITCKASGDVVSVNPGLAKIVGGTVEQIQMQNFRSLDSWRNSGMISAADEVLASGVEKRIEVHSVTTFGNELRVSCLFVPFFHDGAQYLLVMISDVSEQKRAEEALRQSNAFNEMLLKTIPFGIDIVDASGNVLFANDNMKKLHRADAVGRRCWTIYKDDKTQCENCPLIPGMGPNDTTTLEVKGVFGGRTFQVNHTGMTYQGNRAILEVFQDVTERKSLQEQLLQSQKLESIGQLAGGVAHDYNNILSVIIGYAQLLKLKFKAGDDNERLADSILGAANRGADLTKQLLAFARKEIISPKTFSVNSAIASFENILRRMIGENINLLFRPDQDVWNIKLDPSQFDQILLNLAANSREAIKGVGTIVIETTNVTVDEDYARSHPELNAGKFVKLTFSDTGMGMDQETIKKIFEPFFTTREKGHGTGMGLATVYGIVKQNNGNIYVTSEPGTGTAFEIYLPPSYEELDKTEEQPSEVFIHGTETILVVEDQVELLELAMASLENYGYHVLTAPVPGEALRLCETYDGEIHLLLTDVIMPVMSGKKLSENVKNLRPGIKTLFMSGYTSDELSPEGVLDDEIEFIQKPFTPAELAKKVSEVLQS